MGNNIPKENNEDISRCSSPSNTIILLTTTTWKRESYGLFDYECKNLIRDQLKINGPCFLVREKDEIKPIKEIPIDSKNFNPLAELSYKNGNFYLEVKNYDLLPNENTTQKSEIIGDHCLWSVIRNPKDVVIPLKYLLKKRDCIKFGRIKIRIRDFKSNILKKEDKHKEYLENNGLSALLKDSAKNSCRICLVDEISPDNPLISPCNCSGTMKYLHLKCLQQWLKTKVKSHQYPFFSTIEWRKFECDLCQFPFPDYLQGNNGEYYETVEIPKPEGNYLILEFLNKETNVIENLYIMNMEKKFSLKFGRGVDNDIRVNDISVSRVHAHFILENGQFYVQDNNSKFGTLVLIDKPLEMQKNLNNLELQIGRTVIKINVKRKISKAFGCFGVSRMDKLEKIDKIEKNEKIDKIDKKSDIPIQKIDNNFLNNGLPPLESEIRNFGQVGVIDFNDSDDD